MTIAPTATASSAAAPANPLGSLSSNFGNFLSLLMTQLKNQDPTSPLDTNQFTSQLVQFSSVEQQINTNTSLTKLIELTQTGSLLQSSAMVGKTVAVQSDQLVVQNGTAGLRFTTPTAEPVEISITNAAGKKLLDTTVPAASGPNTWTWDGKDAAGNTVPDGLYAVSVQAAGASGTAAAVPFTVVGTATGVTSQNNTVQLRIGALSCPFSRGSDAIFHPVLFLPVEFL